MHENEEKGKLKYTLTKKLTQIHSTNTTYFEFKNKKLNK